MFTLPPPCIYSFSNLVSFLNARSHVAHKCCFLQFLYFPCDPLVVTRQFSQWLQIIKTFLLIAIFEVHTISLFWWLIKTIVWMQKEATSLQPWVICLEKNGFRIGAFYDAIVHVKPSIVHVNVHIFNKMRWNKYFYTMKFHINQFTKQKKIWTHTTLVVTCMYQFWGENTMKIFNLYKL